MAYKICIDPGHGGKDPGACLGSRKESQDVLRVALEVEKLLTAAGMDVCFTRTSDVYETPSEKAKKANAWGADLFVSLHRNAAQPSANGVEILLFSKEGTKAELAEKLCNRYQGIGFTNRGIKIRTDLTVLRKTAMPAMLIEMGFITNQEDNHLFDSKFNEIVHVTAEEIVKFFGMNLVVPLSETSGWIEQSGRWWYRDADGSYPKNTWRNINQKWYYFGKDGWMHIGWLKYKNMWFYFAGDGSMVKGLHKIGEKQYVFNSEKGSTEGACMETESGGALHVMGA